MPLLLVFELLDATEPDDIALAATLFVTADEKPVLAIPLLSESDAADEAAVSDVAALVAVTLAELLFPC